jgi:hypothetical protein
VRDKAGSAPTPAIVTRSFGKGRVVYFAAGVDSAYYLYPYPYQRMLLTSAIGWAAGGQCPVSVKAPMCVHATFFRQARDGKRRMVVQLFNDINTAGNHAMPNDVVPLREETLPVHDIELTFRGEKIASAFEEPDHRKLELRRGDDGAVTVVLPRLEVHSLIELDVVE